MFYSAIKKYGWNNINHQIFEVADETSMVQNEIKLIEMFQTTNPKYGYNIAKGGYAGVGRPHTEEEKKHQSEQLIKWWTEERKKEYSEKRKGKKHKPCSEETRKKISLAKKGKKRNFECSEEYRRKMSENNKHPKRKCLWLTPDCDVVMMTYANVSKWHFDYVKIEDCNEH